MARVWWLTSGPTTLGPAATGPMPAIVRAISPSIDRPFPKPATGIEDSLALWGKVDAQILDTGSAVSLPTR